MDEQRRRPVRKKKLRKGRIFITALIFLLIAAGIYMYAQFKAGESLAGNDMDMTEMEFTADDFDNKIENFLLIGVDSRGESQSRSDTMMLLSLNHETNNMKLVSFMRDIYADIPEYGYNKLNSAYYFGEVNLLKQTLNNMFDVPIHHYAVIDFTSFESLIDVLAPNGVDIYVEKDMSEKIYVELTQGQHRLNGKELLGYARFRADSEGDFGRVDRQQQVIEALKEEFIKPSNLKNMPKFVGALEGYIQTDLSKTDQLKTGLSAITTGDMTIDRITIPAEGTYSFGRSAHAGSIIEIDVEENKRILHEFLDSEQDGLQ